MKLLHICSFYADNVLYKNLFEKLSSIGVKNTVYVPCKPNGIKKWKEEKICGDIEIIYECAYRQGKNLFEKGINIINKLIFFIHSNNIYKKLKAKINIENYDIVHAHSLFTNGYLAYKLKKEFDIDYIVAIRNTDVNFFFKKTRYLRKIGVDIMKNAKYVIFISESYHKEVLESYIKPKEIHEIKDKCIVIPNGIDDFWINSINDDRKKAIDKKVKLIQVSRIDNNKNIAAAINICENLRNEGIAAELTIVGTGPLEEELREAYGKKSYIAFVGKKEKNEIIKYYDQSHIFIMLSKFETFGLVYPEAMSRGLPIICTKGQGIDGFFKEGEVGISVQYNDIMGGVQGVKKIIKNYDAISYKAQVESRAFSWSAIAEIYEKLYKEGVK